MEGRAAVRVAGFFVGAGVDKGFGGDSVRAESGEVERRAPAAGLCGVLVDSRLQKLSVVVIEEEGGRWIGRSREIGVGLDVNRDCAECNALREGKASADVLWSYMIHNWLLCCSRGLEVSNCDKRTTIAFGNGFHCYCHIA